MSTNTTPKFWFDVDGLRYGARFLTIAEQASAQVEIDRVTNGKFAAWIKSENETESSAAAFVQMAAYLNRVIVQWPDGMEPVNFLEHDSPMFVFKLWEAYGSAANSFRQQHDAAGSRGAVVG